MSGPLLVRHIGGGLIGPAGPVSLARARVLAERLREILDRLEGEIAAAELWRRAAGWTHPDAADTHP